MLDYHGVYKNTKILVNHVLGEKNLVALRNNYNIYQVYANVEIPVFLCGFIPKGFLGMK